MIDEERRANRVDQDCRTKLLSKVWRRLPGGAGKHSRYGQRLLMIDTPVGEEEGCSRQPSEDSLKVKNKTEGKEAGR